MTFFIFDVMFSCGCTGSFKIFDFVPVYTGIFLNSIYHCDTFKRFAQIHLDTVVGNGGCAKNSLCNIAIHILSQIHHAVVIGVCLIKLHQCKLWIMTCIQSLVTEYTADLVNTLHASDDQSLQIQFQGNTQLQVFVQCIEMCFERSCCCTAGIGYQHRCFNFQESLSVQILTYCTDDPGTFDKGFFYVCVHDQIDITLTITDVGIGQTMKFFRKNLKTLGKQSYLGCMNGNFAGLCFKYFTFQTYDISDVHFFESFVFFLTDAVSCHIRLDIALQILDIAERCFSHYSLGHHTSCEHYTLPDPQTDL